MIHDPKYNFCLRWSSDGQQVYLNRNDFEIHYLRTPDNQFHTQKAISFVRQMNMYGFRKVDDCFYENDNFKRDCPHLLRNLVRRHSNKNFFSSNVSAVAAASPMNGNSNINNYINNNSTNYNDFLDLSTISHHNDQVATISPTLTPSVSASTLPGVPSQLSAYQHYNQLPQSTIVNDWERQQQIMAADTASSGAQILPEASNQGLRLNPGGVDSNFALQANILAAINLANQNITCFPLASSLYLRLAAIFGYNQLAGGNTNNQASAASPNSMVESSRMTFSSTSSSTTSSPVLRKREQF